MHLTLQCSINKRVNSFITSDIYHVDLSRFTDGASSSRYDITSMSFFVLN